jgi:hypothetical protein
MRALPLAAAVSRMGTMTMMLLNQLLRSGAMLGFALCSTLYPCQRHRGRSCGRWKTVMSTLFWRPVVCNVFRTRADWAG